MKCKQKGCDFEGVKSMFVGQSRSFTKDTGLCRGCDRALSRAYYKANKEKVALRKALYRKDNVAYIRGLEKAARQRAQAKKQAKK